MKLLVLAMLAVAQTPPPEQELPARRIPETNPGHQAQLLTAELQKLGDWEPQHEFIDAAVENLWSENEWTSESDLFARETLTEVAKIPPWELNRRLETIVERVSDRYDMPADKRDAFRSSIYRETFGFMLKNAPLLLEHTQEYVGMRVRGEPFTAEAIAEWTQESESLMEDWLSRSERMIETFEASIPEEHRGLLERDLESYHRRVDAIQDMRESWANGGWKPEHWGLQNDPIQLKAALSAAEATPGFSDAERAALDRTGMVPKVHFAYDPSTWEAYVRNFIALYALDPGQTTAAESILVELLTRATDHLKANMSELAVVPRVERQRHEHFAVIRGMFEELKRRLARIPTAAQKRAVANLPERQPAEQTRKLSPDPA